MLMKHRWSREVEADGFAKRGHTDCFPIELLLLRQIWHRSNREYNFGAAELASPSGPLLSRSLVYHPDLQSDPVLLRSGG